MPIQSEQKGDCCHIRVEDELTIYTASEFKQTLIPKLDDAREVVLDLSGVTEMDSAGLQLLLLLKRHAEQQQHEFSIINHSRAVIEILELTELVSHFGDPLVIPAEWRAS